MREKAWMKSGAVLLAVAAILQGLARWTDGFGSWYAVHIYPLFVSTIGRIAGCFPVSIVEYSLYGLIIVCLGYGINCGIKCLKERKNSMLGAWLTLLFHFFTRLFCLVSFLFLIYTLNCGLNYYAVPFSAYSGLEVQEASVEELYQLCEMLVERINESVRDLDYRKHKKEWRQAGVEAMENLGNQYPSLAGYYPQPKEVGISRILSIQQLCGIYSPFTIEANFNGEMPDYNIPHTICHELSHLRGFMREDEANFIGYLACIGSENPDFSYSGYLSGWVYAGNALAGADWDNYAVLYEKLSPSAKEDLRDNNAFWNQYEGKVAEVSNKWNDTYLKMNSQTDGVKSYGRVVDLMLAYYRNFEKP